MMALMTKKMKYAIDLQRPGFCLISSRCSDSLNDKNNLNNE
jgi:hypothetical protein